MNIEVFREYCLRKPGADESLPFGPQALVFKVAGKIFALADLEEFASVTLKCDPEHAVMLRERYPAVLPGYHMNKTHWNTILMDHSVPDAALLDWVNESYTLVVQSLPKKHRQELSSTDT